MRFSHQSRMSQVAVKNDVFRSPPHEFHALRIGGISGMAVDGPVRVFVARKEHLFDIIEGSIVVATTTVTGEVSTEIHALDFGTKQI